MYEEELTEKNVADIIEFSKMIIRNLSYRDPEERKEYKIGSPGLKYTIYEILGILGIPQPTWTVGK